MIECRSTQSSVTILGNEELGSNYDSIMKRFIMHSQPFSTLQYLNDCKFKFQNVYEIQTQKFALFKQGKLELNWRFYFKTMH